MNTIFYLSEVKVDLQVLADMVLITYDLAGGARSGREATEGHHMILKAFYAPLQIHQYSTSSYSWATPFWGSLTCMICSRIAYVTTRSEH